MTVTEKLNIAACIFLEPRQRARDREIISVIKLIWMMGMWKTFISKIFWQIFFVRQQRVYWRRRVFIMSEVWICSPDSWTCRLVWASSHLFSISLPQCSCRCKTSWIWYDIMGSFISDNLLPCKQYHCCITLHNAHADHLEQIRFWVMASRRSNMSFQAVCCEGILVLQILYPCLVQFQFSKFQTCLSVLHSSCVGDGVILRNEVSLYI